MNLRRNILASYASQIYVIAAGILMQPMYIKYMGAEVYGLVGFFAMLQAWFGLLDLGLTPTIGRETARYHSGTLSALTYRKIYRALSLIFIGIGLVGSGGMYLLSGQIANGWLNVGNIPVDKVVLSVQIMAISSGLKWICGLYRGVVTGSEKIVWLSSFNAVIATLRFVVVLPAMWYFGFNPVVFFIYQLLVALAEIIGLGLKVFQLLPEKKIFSESIGWSFKPVQPLLKFSLTIAITTVVWLLVTQTDKLLLSGVLSLAEYGYFTLAVLSAGGIMMISGPISNAIMPRMSRLHMEGRHDELIQIYRSSTRLVSIISGSASITLACCAEPFLYAWTGDLQLAEATAPILRLYAIGNGFLAIAAFPYYLQYAKGDLRYHFIGNIGLVVILIPCLLLATTKFGAQGAGYVWLVLNGLYLFAWVPYIHHKLEPGLHGRWIKNDVFVVILPALFIGLTYISLDTRKITRFSSLIATIMVALLTLVISYFFEKFAKPLFRPKKK